MAFLFKSAAAIGFFAVVAFSTTAQQEAAPPPSSPSLAVGLTSGTLLVPEAPVTVTPTPLTPSEATTTATTTPAAPAAPAPATPAATAAADPAAAPAPSTATAPSEKKADNGVIVLRPLPVLAKDAIGPLGFTIRAPWMTGDIRLRMPETLITSLGLHFIDQSRPEMPPISMLETPPEWKTDPATGDISYETQTKEGIVFGGKAHADTETVTIEFWVANGTANPISNVAAQICLSLEGSPEFGRKNVLNTTFAWVNGAPLSLAQTTPTAEQKARAPWIVMLTTSMVAAYTGPLDYAGGWWVVDQTADFNIIARSSEDNKHLVAITWDETYSQLMADSNIPCLHAGPIRALPLQQREKATLRGKIYLIPNDTNQLLARYLKDAEAWFTPGK